MKLEPQCPKTRQKIQSSFIYVFLKQLAWLRFLISLHSDDRLTVWTYFTFRLGSCVCRICFLQLYEIWLIFSRGEMKSSVQFDACPAGRSFGQFLQGHASMLGQLQTGLTKRDDHSRRQVQVSAPPAETAPSSTAQI